MHNAVSTYLLTFWQQIQPVDFWLIKHINQDWSNGIFDAVLPLFRETLFWVPLYFFLLLYALLNFKTKGYWWILGGVLTAAISDLLSSHLIKENIFRLRPCQNPEVAPYLRFFINYCPQSSSFTSSHATTYFAQAVFFYLTLKPVQPKSWIFFIWAALISYTQVYVGVHYPFDVLCGALLGCMIGWSISRLFQQQIGTLAVS